MTPDTKLVAGLEDALAAHANRRPVGRPQIAQREASRRALQRDRGVPAIFAETTQPTVLAKAVAAEVGTAIAVIELYSESLGLPGTSASTLPGMLIENARRIAAALS